MHCALSGTAGFLSYQQFNGIQHHKVDGIDQVIPPLVPLALAAPLAVIQQQQRDGRQHGEAGPQGAVGLHHEEQGHMHPEVHQEHPPPGSQGVGHMGDHRSQQQPLRVLSAAVGVIIPLGDEKAHNGRGDHAEAEQGIVSGVGGGDEENRHMLADHGHHSQQLQCVGVQSGLPGHGDTLFPVGYLCGYLNT